MKCFYHTDMDGHCSGAIVWDWWAKKKGVPSKEDFIAINYNNDFPFESITANEEVFIVDFSLQKEGEFEKLLSITKNITWIDHHFTAIEKHKDVEDKINGVRVVGIAACQLTWDYFFPSFTTPTVVKLLADYDVWRFKYDNDTRFLQIGIRLYETHPWSPLWMGWLNSNFSPDSIIEKGEIITTYQNNVYRGLIKAWSFYAELHGYMVIACNAGSVPSLLFDSVDPITYDIMCPFVFDGQQWTISLYTKDPEINVGEIAKLYGGGGHKEAAGFQCKELPFKYIRRK